MPYPEQLETARLRAERIDSGHFDEICLLHRDPLVMATLTADGQPVADEVTRVGLERHTGHWELHGYGFWVFRAKEDGRFIGRGGLGQYEVDGEEMAGLSYAVVSGEWGRGYATEMGRASVEVGFDGLGREWIGSWTLAGNEASRRVMEKLGFRYEKEIEFAGLAHLFFRLRKAWYKGSL
jgi:ribosomal-protein-alanine N-acetyltransferase